MFTAAHQLPNRVDFIIIQKICILLKTNWIMVTSQNDQKKPKTTPKTNPHNNYMTAYWQLQVMDVSSIRWISGMEKIENVRTGLILNFSFETSMAPVNRFSQDLSALLLG